MDRNSFYKTIKIPSYSDLTCSALGLDSPDHCFDQKHYKQYPQFEYKFNSLGYRTVDPTTWTGKEILVLGDSFTLGLGCSAEDIYTSQLEKTLNYPVLNFSLNGASNDWINRKLGQLLEFFDPPAVVVHYTFSHRRECPREDWFDDERTMCDPLPSAAENYNNWHENFKSICNQNCNVVHSFITDWHPEPVSYDNKMIPPIKKIDLARDGFHYGPRTHQAITNLLADELRQFL